MANSVIFVMTAFKDVPNNVPQLHKPNSNRHIQFCDSMTVEGDYNWLHNRRCDNNPNSQVLNPPIYQVLTHIRQFSDQTNIARAEHQPYRYCSIAAPTDSILQDCSGKLCNARKWLVKTW